MFGFLKQKLADFTNKLKQKGQAKNEANETQKEKIEEKKETNAIDSTQEPETENTKEIQKKQEQKTKNQKKEKPTQKIEEKQKTTLKEKTTEETKKQEKKLGIIEKLLNLGKTKKEKTEQKLSEEQETGEKKLVEKKKKTKEEIAKEMKEKMFNQIKKEICEETKDAGEEKLTKTPPMIGKKTMISVEEKLTKEIEEEEIEENTTKEQPKEISEKEKTIEKKKDDNQKETKTQKEDSGKDKTEEEKELIVEEKVERKEKPRDIKIKTLEEEKRELKTSLGFRGKIKGFLFGGVEISEKDINDLLWELELSLIESDVEQEAASELVKQIKQKLVGQKVSIKQIDEYIKEQIKEILTEMMKTKEIDLLKIAENKKTEKKPLVLLMLGPNGAGKTTSIAKLVHYFKKNKLTCIIAAGDTFRAGAIDQIEEHAKRLNVRVIKQQYGADPAAVAFDAIKAAEAGKINVVLIDSAGRQETNKNLMEELRKIERIAKPDLRIYVGEAYAGQTLLDQVNEFNEMIGIDAFVLTKIDADAKGGTAISLLYKTKKPIIFVGTGQEYDDFKEFTPNFILERII